MSDDIEEIENKIKSIEERMKEIEIYIGVQKELRIIRLNTLSWISRNWVSILGFLMALGAIGWELKKAAP